MNANKLYMQARAERKMRNGGSDPQRQNQEEILAQLEKQIEEKKIQKMKDDLREKQETLEHYRKTSGNDPNVRDLIARKEVEIADAKARLAGPESIIQLLPNPINPFAASSAAAQSASNPNESDRERRIRMRREEKMYRGAGDGPVSPVQPSRDAGGLTSSPTGIGSNGPIGLGAFAPRAIDFSAPPVPVAVAPTYDDPKSGVGKTKRDEVWEAKRRARMERQQNQPQAGPAAPSLPLFPSAPSAAAAAADVSDAPVSKASRLAALFDDEPSAPPPAVSFAPSNAGKSKRDEIYEQKKRQFMAGGANNNDDTYSSSAPSAPSSYAAPSMRPASPKYPASSSSGYSNPYNRAPSPPQHQQYPPSDSGGGGLFGGLGAERAKPKFSHDIPAPAAAAAAPPLSNHHNRQHHQHDDSNAGGGGGGGLFGGLGQDKPKPKFNHDIPVPSAGSYASPDKYGRSASTPRARNRAVDDDEPSGGGGGGGFFDRMGQQDRPKDRIHQHDIPAPQNNNRRKENDNVETSFFDRIGERQNGNAPAAGRRAASTPRGAHQPSSDMYGNNGNSREEQKRRLADGGGGGGGGGGGAEPSFFDRIGEREAHNRGHHQQQQQQQAPPVEDRKARLQQQAENAGGGGGGLFGNLGERDKGGAWGGRRGNDPHNPSAAAPPSSQYQQQQQQQQQQPYQNNRGRKPQDDYSGGGGGGLFAGLGSGERPKARALGGAGPAPPPPQAPPPYDPYGRPDPYGYPPPQQQQQQQQYDDGYGRGSWPQQQPQQQQQQQQQGPPHGGGMMSGMGGHQDAVANAKAEQQRLYRLELQQQMEEQKNKKAAEVKRRKDEDLRLEQAIRGEASGGPAAPPGAAFQVVQSPTRHAPHPGAPRDNLNLFGHSAAPVAPSYPPQPAYGGGGGYDAPQPYGMPQPYQQQQQQYPSQYSPMAGPPPGAAAPPPFGSPTAAAAAPAYSRGGALASLMGVSEEQKILEAQKKAELGRELTRQREEQKLAKEKEKLKIKMEEEEAERRYLQQVEDEKKKEALKNAPPPPPAAAAAPPTPVAAPAAPAVVVVENVDPREARRQRLKARIWAGGDDNKDDDGPPFGAPVPVPAVAPSPRFNNRDDLFGKPALEKESGWKAAVSPSSGGNDREVEAKMHEVRRALTEIQEMKEAFKENQKAMKEQLVMQEQIMHQLRQQIASGGNGEQQQQQPASVSPAFDVPMPAASEEPVPARRRRGGGSQLAAPQPSGFAPRPVFFNDPLPPSDSPSFDDQPAVASAASPSPANFFADPVQKPERNRRKKILDDDLFAPKAPPMFESEPELAPEPMISYSNKKKFDISALDEIAVNGRGAYDLQDKSPFGRPQQFSQHSYGNQLDAAALDLAQSLRASAKFLYPDEHPSGADNDGSYGYGADASDSVPPMFLGTPLRQSEVFTSPVKQQKPSQSQINSEKRSKHSVVADMPDAFAQVAANHRPPVLNLPPSNRSKTPMRPGSAAEYDVRSSSHRIQDAIREALGPSSSSSPFPIFEDHHHQQEDVSTPRMTPRPQSAQAQASSRPTTAQRSYTPVSSRSQRSVFTPRTEELEDIHDKTMDRLNRLKQIGEKWQDGGAFAKDVISSYLSPASSFAAGEQPKPRSRPVSSLLNAPGLPPKPSTPTLPLSKYDDRELDEYDDEGPPDSYRSAASSVSRPLTSDLELLRQLQANLKARKDEEMRERQRAEEERPSRGNSDLRLQVGNQRPHSGKNKGMEQSLAGETKFVHVPRMADPDFGSQSYSEAYDG